MKKQITYIQTVALRSMLLFYFLMLSVVAVRSQNVIFTKEFLGSGVVGGTVELKFTITNNESSPITGLTFTDDLNAVLTGLETSGLPLGNICRSGSNISGTSFLTFTGGGVPGGSSCDFTITLQIPSGAVPGTYTNTTSQLTGSLGGNPFSINGASGDLVIEGGPTFTKSFSPSSIPLGGSSTLHFMIDNSANTSAATGLDFTDNLPAGIMISNPALASTTCTGGVLTALAGTGNISYTGGTVAAGATCVVSVGITSTAYGTHQNTTGNLTSSLGSSGTATHTITVAPSQPEFDMEFVPGQIKKDSISTLTYTISNPNGTIDFNSLGFVDDLPAGLRIAAVPNVITSCAGAMVTAPAGGTSIVFSNGALNAMDICTVQVDVTSRVSGFFQNEAELNAGRDPIRTVAGLGVDPELDITLSDSISYDPSMDQVANPNDSIRYTLKIKNIGDTSVYNLSIGRGSDPNITLDPSTIQATPVAINDTFELMGAPMTVPAGNGLLANDFDINDPLPSPPFNTNLLVLSVEGGAPGSPQVTASGGAVTVNTDGSFTYDSTGVATAIADSFFYKIIDSEGFQDSARVLISWTRPPAAQNDDLASQINLVHNFGPGALYYDNGYGTDDLGIPEGEIISFGGGDAGGTVTMNAAGNTITFAGGMLTVEADGNLILTNATVPGVFTFMYRIQNSLGFSDATVTLTIHEPPSAQPDSYTFLYSSDQNINTGSGLFVDNGSGADDLGFQAATLTTFGGGILGGTSYDHPAGTSVALAGGTLTVNVDGSWSLTGQPFTPGTYTFDYRIENAVGASNATVTFIIQDPPMAQDDDLMALVNTVNNYPADTLYMDNGFGVDHLGSPAASIVRFGGGSLGGSVTDNVAGSAVAFAGGMLTVNADGSLSVSNPSMHGIFTFEYRIQNSSGFSDATVTVTINEPPVAQRDTYEFLFDVDQNEITGTGLFVDHGSGADNLGYPTATLTTFGGGSLGGAVTDHAAGVSVALADGTLTVHADGGWSLTGQPFTKDTFSFDYRLESSSGASDATVILIIKDDPPVAQPDTYTATGNISINTTTMAGQSVLVNDAGNGLFVSAVQGAMANVNIATATTQGGSVVVQVNGEFSYTPPTGFTGSDTFTYTAGNSSGQSSPVLVTITVSDLIYFMDDAASPGGDGSLTKPYKTIAEYNGAPPPPNSHLFIADNGNSYSGDLTLVAGQTVIGEGSMGALFGVGSLTGITLAALSNSVPYSTTGNVSDWAQFVNPSGNAVTLNSDNRITGLSIGNRTIYAFTDNGASVGTLFLKETEITGTGGGLKIENGGTLDVDLTDLTTSGGAYGLWLKSTSGTVAVSGGMITNPTTSAITIDGGSVNTTFTLSSISQSSNTNTVSVLGGHTGILTYSGTVNATNGNGLQFDNADGQYNFNNTVILNGGDAGIDIVNDSGGSFTFSNTTITNPTGTAFNVNGSSANVSYLGGAMTQNSTASGVVINTNTSIVRIGAQLDLNTATNPAIRSSGGGAVEITNANNTISTTTVAAVTIDGTTIAASGVTLKSVSSDGAPRAIYLNNAGPASGGFFTVTGTGSTDGSGGTIQNITNRGVEIVNTNQVTLKNMDFSNVGTINGAGPCHSLDNVGCHAGIYGSQSNDIVLDNLSLNGGAQIGINGKNINNFTLTNSVVQGFGDQVNEHGVYMRELTGNATINNSTIKASSERNVLIETSSGSLNFVSNGATYSESSLTLGADGLEFGLKGTTTATIDIDNCNFLKNRTNGLQVQAEGSANVTQCDVTNSTFDPMGGPGIGVNLASANNGQIRFNVIGNPKIYGNKNSAVNITSFDNGQLEGRVKDNPDIQVGGAGTSGHGIGITINDQSRGIIEIENNTIGGIGNDIGINAVARSRATGMGACGLACTDGRLEATITNNVVSVADPVLSLGIRTQAQEENTVCADVKNNLVNSTGTAFRTRTNDANATLLLEGFNTSPTVTWVANGNNSVGTVSESHIVGTVTGASCILPSNPMP
ncbi:hypothetical protein KUV50_01605 [Membranicola marinus]|uniref:DUF7933 domain-containing protein n=1 Tax=Membranihabitans marinus TaxID=1227546 RepID=A0A953HJE2_9BACT|nr:Ig-like domain-containing protein [Membranihabitans marinus]MBY5956812.1 hypothetical protein [Membranihabitans marinus]